MSTTASTLAPASTMRAVVRHRYGSADVVDVEQRERPAVGPDEVLVEVRAAGLDRGVWHLLTGQPYLVRLMYGLRRPKQPVLGFDVAGTVVEVGRDATRVAVGDEVFGIADGSFADYAVASESKLVVRPANVAVESAAVSTVSGITALQALTEVGRLEPGQRVLVIGASGGVGSFAVQLAAAIGAHVTGVASTAKLDAVRSFGADEVIDYRREGLVAPRRTFDLVLDIGGRRSVSTLRELLTPTGTLVIVGGEGGGKITGGIGRQLWAKLRSPFVRQRLTFFISEEHHRFIEPLAEHLANGTVVPAVTERVTLDQLPGAIERLEAGAVTGKVAVTVATD